MGNKKKMIKIKGNFIKERIVAIGSSQVELAKYLDTTPRHVNRCIQNNEMSEEMAVRVCNFLNVSTNQVMEHPKTYGIDNSLIEDIDHFVFDDMSFADQYQLSLKQPDSMKKLFYLILRYCGRTEREIFSYPDDSIPAYMKIIEMLVMDNVIEPHLQNIKMENPNLFDFIRSTESDAIFEREEKIKEKRQMKEEIKKLTKEKKIKNIDQGKINSLSLAGWSDEEIASELNLDIEDLQTAVKNMKEGDAND